MAAHQPYTQQGQGAVPQATQPQAVIITQPTSGGVRMNAYQTYKVKSALRLGSLQIVSGGLSLILAIVHIVVNSPGRQSPYRYGYSNFTYIIGTGIWCGKLVSFRTGP